jgi:hypothetical protein
MCVHRAALQVQRVSALLAVFSLYAAAFLMRYLGLALDVKKTPTGSPLWVETPPTVSGGWSSKFLQSGVVLRLLALVPLVLAWWVLPELADKSSFAVAIVALDRSGEIGRDLLLNTGEKATEAGDRSNIERVQEQVTESASSAGKNSPGLRSELRIRDTMAPLVRPDQNIKFH